MGWNLNDFTTFGLPNISFHFSATDCIPPKRRTVRIHVEDPSSMSMTDAVGQKTISIFLHRL